jgi:FkbM family methyltransferase
MMANVFIDCGTHYGEGLREFMKMFQMGEDWNIHTFEANPVTYSVFESRRLPHLSKNIKAYNYAVTTHDGTIDMYVESPDTEIRDTGQGSSIISKDKWNPQDGILKFKEELVPVPCIDLSKFVELHTSEDDFIVMKLDVEGAEYDILDKMLEEMTLHRISHLFVEFHAKYFTNLEEMRVREAKLVNKIKSEGINLHHWG